MALVNCRTRECEHQVREGLRRPSYERGSDGQELADGEHCWRCRRRQAVGSRPAQPRQREKTRPMATPFQQYKDALDRLRELRRLAEDTDERQSAIYEEQAPLWNAMDDADRSEIRELGWRSWPDQYDQRERLD